MSNLLKVRRGLKADLPTLEQGELGFCTDTEEVYIGTGVANILINSGGGGVSEDLVWLLTSLGL